MLAVQGLDSRPSWVPALRSNFKFSGKHWNQALGKASWDFPAGCKHMYKKGNIFMSYALSLYIHINTCVHIYIYTYMYIHKYRHACVYAYTSVYTHIHICICAHIHVGMRMHTHMYFSSFSHTLYLVLLSPFSWKNLRHGENKKLASGHTAS